MEGLSLVNKNELRADSNRSSKGKLARQFYSSVKIKKKKNAPGQASVNLSILQKNERETLEAMLPELRWHGGGRGLQRKREKTQCVRESNLEERERRACKGPDLPSWMNS